MLAIFLQTLPFFMLIGCGFAAAKSGMFPEAAVGYLTKFVFFFALSAMLFRFASSLPVSELFDPAFLLAYLGATFVLYCGVAIVARASGRRLDETAVEAQCAVIGNVGFLGIPLYVTLLGDAAAAPVLMVLSVDLIIFGSIIVLVITGSRDGRVSPAVVVTMTKGLLRNPMVMSIGLGLVWSIFALPIPGPIDRFLELLGAAATPGALFAIGASLAVRRAERLGTAVWLSSLKLAVHPTVCALFALVLIPLDPFAAGVMIATAALPTAGNVFMLAEHYGVAQQRASATILVSTIVSVVTLSLVLGLVAPLTG